MKGLQNDGDHGFSDATIYKVSIPKKDIEEAKNDGRRLITYIMVEATLNVFKDEAAVTIYLRDVTHFVEVQKCYLKAQEAQIMNEAEEEIVDALADIMHP